MLAGVLLAALLLAGCSEDDGTAAAQTAAPPPVEVAHPIVRQIIEWDEYTGRFEATDFVEVRARVSGYLDEVHFEDGQMVQEGDLLFTIDQRPFRLALQQAEADLSTARTRLLLAEQELARALELIGRGHIAQAVVDQRTQARDEARAAIEAGEAAVNTAKLNLEYTNVSAPLSGRTSRHFVSEGNLIVGDATNATLLTTIVSMDPIYFYFDADEQAYLKYVRLARDGQRRSSRDQPNPVELSLLDEDDFRHRGFMNFVDNVIDEETGTVRGRAEFPNRDLVFVPGLFGRLRLLGSGEYDAIMLPDDVIGTDQSRKFVYVLGDDNIVRTRIVDLGPLHDGLRIIRSGLSADDLVIVNGIQKARDGQPVSPEEIVLPGGLQKPEQAAAAGSGPGQ